jgi:hypothetical protein
MLPASLTNDRLWRMMRGVGVDMEDDPDKSGRRQFNQIYEELHFAIGGRSRTRIHCGGAERIRLR